MQLRWWMLWIIGSWVVAGISLILLYFIWNNVCPTTSVSTTNGLSCIPSDGDALPFGTLVLFLVPFFLAVGGLVLPPIAYLNQRFAKPDWLERDLTRLLRQSGWLGLYSTMLVYLQLIQVLNWAMIVVLGAMFLLIEILYLTRDD